MTGLQREAVLEDACVCARHPVRLWCVYAVIPAFVAVLDRDALIRAGVRDLVELVPLLDHPLEVLRVPRLQPDDDLSRLPRGDSTGHRESPLLANAALLVHVVLLPRLEREDAPLAQLLLSQL